MDITAKPNQHHEKKSMYIYFWRRMPNKYFSGVAEDYFLVWYDATRFHFIFSWRIITLQYVFVSAIHQHESVIGIYICLLPLESPSHLPPLPTTLLGFHRARGLGSLRYITWTCSISSATVFYEGWNINLQLDRADVQVCSPLEATFWGSVHPFLHDLDARNCFGGRQSCLFLSEN